MLYLSSVCHSITVDCSENTGMARSFERAESDVLKVRSIILSHSDSLCVIHYGYCSNEELGGRSFEGRRMMEVTTSGYASTLAQARSKALPLPGYDQVTLLLNVNLQFLCLHTG